MSAFTIGDRNAVGSIAFRAADEYDADYRRVFTTMIALHTGPCPMRLRDLRDASPEDFRHDVYGILDNYDPMRGILLNHFSPRFATQPKET